MTRLRFLLCFFVLLISGMADGFAQDSSSIFRGASWGMTSAEVIASEQASAKLVRRERDSLFAELTSIYYETTLAGIPVLIDYHFFKDTLFHIWVHGTRDYWKYLDQGIDDFYTLMNALHARYDSLHSYYATTDRDLEDLDSNTALMLGHRTYAAIYRPSDGSEVYLYYDRAGYDDDVPRAQKMELWFGIVNYENSIHERADAYKVQALRDIEAAEEAERQRIIDEARAKGEQDAVDF